MRRLRAVELNSLRHGSESALISQRFATEAWDANRSVGYCFKERGAPAIFTAAEDTIGRRMRTARE